MSRYEVDSVNENTAVIVDHKIEDYIEVEVEWRARFVENKIDGLIESEWYECEVKADRFSDIIEEYLIEKKQL